MKRIWLAVLALCGWAAVALPAHAVVLRYTPKVGAVAKHKVTVAGRMQADMEGAGETMRMEMDGWVEYTESALSETADTVRIETRLTAGKMTMKMGEESQSEEMPTGRMVADMDRRGRLVKMVEADFGGEVGAADFMSGGMGNWSSFSAFSAFPEGDVKVDDTWSDEVRLPSFEGGPEIALSANSRLLELGTYGGRHCAKVRTYVKGPMKFSMPGMEGIAEQMEATLQGTVVWYYDYENSVYVSGEGSLGMEMTMGMAPPDMPEMQMTTKMLINFKLSLVR